MVALAKELVQGFRDLRLVVSSKTRLIASSDEIGRELEPLLRELGVPLEYVRDAVDLGIDAAAYNPWMLLPGDDALCSDSCAIFFVSAVAPST